MGKICNNTGTTVLFEHLNRTGYILRPMVNLG